jgi:hypothetical protein
VLGEQRPEFSWSEVPEATEYRVWISKDFSDKPPILTTVSLNYYVPEMDLGIGRFNFWVQAVQADGKRLPWSFSQSFEIATAVTLPVLPRRVTTPRISISWPVIPGADAYEVYLSNLSTGQAGVIREVVTTNAWEPAIDLGLAQWRIWVRAVWRGRYQAWWSNPRDFTVVSAPVPAAPLNFSVQLQPEFRWSAVEGADRYGFQLRNAVTGRVVIDVRGLTSPTFTPSSPVASGRYRWWAIAESTTTGIRSDWSVGVDLVISDRPVLLSPSGRVPSQNLNLTWMAFPGAVSYEVWVTRMQPLQFVVSAANVTQTEWTVPVTLLSEAPHRFWVRAVTSDGRTTAWSQYLEFSMSDAAATSTGTDHPLLSQLVDQLVFGEVSSQLTAGFRPDRSVRKSAQRLSASHDTASMEQEPVPSKSQRMLDTSAVTARADGSPVHPMDEFQTPAVLDQAILLAIAELDHVV